MEQFHAQFTKEALVANDGKTVPLRLGLGGEIIGEATLHWNGDRECLEAAFQIDNPNLVDDLRRP